jgi:hypothetical protein
MEKNQDLGSGINTRIPNTAQNIKRNILGYFPYLSAGSGRHLLNTVVAGCPDLLPGDPVEPLPAVTIILGYTIYILLPNLQPGVSLL